MEHSDLARLKNLIDVNTDVLRKASELLERQLAEVIAERDSLRTVVADTPENLEAALDAIHRSFPIAYHSGWDDKNVSQFIHVVVTDQRRRAGVSDQSVVAEMHYLRWWYVMHMPEVTDGKLPTKEEMRELWKKNTGNEVPKGYKEEDEVW